MSKPTPHLDAELVGTALKRVRQARVKLDAVVSLFSDDGDDTAARTKKPSLFLAPTGSADQPTDDARAKVLVLEAQQAAAEAEAMLESVMSRLGDGTDHWEQVFDNAAALVRLEDTAANWELGRAALIGAALHEPQRFEEYAWPPMNPFTSQSSMAQLCDRVAIGNETWSVVFEVMKYPVSAWPIHETTPDEYDATPTGAVVYRSYTYRIQIVKHAAPSIILGRLRETPCVVVVETTDPTEQKTKVMVPPSADSIVAIISYFASVSGKWASVQSLPPEHEWLAAPYTPPRKPIG
jgi:hypothetical protein